MKNIHIYDYNSKTLLGIIAPTMIPNAIGIVFQVIAIGLWAYLRAKYPDAGQGEAAAGGESAPQTDKPEEKAEGEGQGQESPDANKPEDEEQNVVNDLLGAN